MSKINIEGIVRDIKGRTTYLTPLIEAICNSIDASGGKSGGLIEIMLKRDNQKSTDDVEKNRGIGSIALRVYEMRQQAKVLQEEGSTILENAKKEVEEIIMG